MPDGNEEGKFLEINEVNRFKNRHGKKGKPPSFWDRVSYYWRYLFVVVLIMSGYYAYLHQQGEVFQVGTFFDVFVNTIFSSILVAVLVVSAERIFERTKTAEFLEAELGSFEERITSRMENLVSARYKYGLKQMSKIDDGQIIANPKNTCVMWLNTKFADAKGAEASIEDAIQNGTSVKLLMMHYKNKCGEMRGRESCAHPANLQEVERSGKGYVGELKASQEDLTALYHILLDKKKNDDSRGDFEVRFYHDLPATPILIVESGQRHEEVYTGFYLNKYSSGMPYIQWGSADENFIENIYQYFETKWAYSEKIEYTAENKVD